MKVSKTLLIREQMSLMTPGQIHLTSFFKQELSLYEGLKDLAHPRTNLTDAFICLPDRVMTFLCSTSSSDSVSSQ